MNLQKIKKVFILIVINSIVFYAILVVAEVFVRRSINSEYQSRYVLVNLLKFDKNSEESIKEYYFKGLYNDGLLVKETKITTGELGDIKLSNDVDYDAPFDFVFFGGSTTECYYLSEENRFPIIVNNNLNQDSTLNIINLSKSGKNSYNSLLQLMTQLADAKIKNAIFMHNVNDLSQLIYSDNSYIEGGLGGRFEKTVINLDELSQTTEVLHSYYPQQVIFLIKRIIKDSFQN